ncbi:MAG: hypothetical protein QGH60_18545 [Phycisphaerae bacterium]|jgi:hypothetical protein|nr:hypothetical protein [Phycisphaerae bacterium]
MIDKKTESAPQRPRKRWRKTKWFYGIVLTYVAVTITAGVWWSAYSHRKFREAVDPIIARGEPLAWSDFATDPIPDDQNAAILYKQAMDDPVLTDLKWMLEREFGDIMETLECDSYDLIHEFTAKREVRQKHPDEVQELLGMAKDAFVLCRKARLRDKVDWGGDFSGKAYEDAGPRGLVSCVSIANLLFLAAVEAHDAGRDDDAVEYIRDMIALGDSLIAYPRMINHMICLAVNDIAIQAFEEILPSLEIGDAPGSASIKNIRRLLARLLDDVPLRQGLTLVLMGERSANYEACLRVLNLDLPDGEVDVEFGGDYYSSSIFAKAGYDYCMAPLLRVDAAWSVKRCDAYVRASSSQTLPEYRRAIRQTVLDAEEYFERPSYVRQLSSILYYMFGQSFRGHYRYLAKRQMAGVALAVRMYQIDCGRLPDRLGQLVSDYLANIPQDPMAESGSQIRYVNDPKDPRLYCLGLDGLDDGGAYDADEDEYYHKDTLFFLSNRPDVREKDSDQDE